MKRTSLNYSYYKVDQENYLNGFLSNRNTIISWLSESESFNTKKEVVEPKTIYRLINTTVKQISFSENDFSGGFETEQFLFFCFYRLLEEKKIPARSEEIIFALQKKFELFRRVFNSYNAELRKNSEISDDTNVYSLLSLILQMRFLDNGNFNELSTSLKINDYLASSLSPMTGNTNVLLLSNFLLERFIIADLYGSVN